MDIREFILQKGGEGRHPWEIARVLHIIKMLKDIKSPNIPFSVLDIGCGDCYVASKLKEQFPFVNYSGIDTSLTEELVVKKRKENIWVTNSWSDINEQKYDLILLFDVLEHVKNDSVFLNEVTEKFMSENSYSLITAPFHRFLFGNHDIFLGHFRRYNFFTFRKLSKESNLEIIKQGQFFFMPFLLRIAQKTAQILFYKNDDTSNKQGVGYWKSNGLVTALIVKMLILDFTIFSFFPGLSGYIICKKLV
jgi:SAM-dependent methyltransferase